MIRLATGADVQRILTVVALAPEAYQELIVCSPFIDGETAKVLGRAAVAARRAQCGFTIVTKPEDRSRIVGAICGTRSQAAAAVIPGPGLHAKAYLLAGRHREDSVAVVSSVNLTTAGLNKNIELGVLATPGCDDGAALVDAALAFLRRLIWTRRQMSACRTRR